MSKEIVSKLKTKQKRSDENNSHASGHLDVQIYGISFSKKELLLMQIS